LLEIHSTKESELFIDGRIGDAESLAVLDSTATLEPHCVVDVDETVAAPSSARFPISRE